LPFNSKVSIKVFDITGREVAVLADGYQNAGSHFVTFNAGNIASGVYFYRIVISSGYSETMRMLLTK
jgi:hypothetical protein